MRRVSAHLSFTKRKCLSVGSDHRFLRKKNSSSFAIIGTFKAVLAAFALFMFTVHSRAQENNPRLNQKVQASVPSAPAGRGEKENFKKRTPEEIFEALNAVLQAMNNDMEEFNFDKIHPHLKVIYSLYNELRLLSLDNIDSLVAQAGKTDSTAAKKGLSSINLSRAIRADSFPPSKDSLVNMVIDTGTLFRSSPAQLSSIGPRVDLKNFNPSKNNNDSNPLGNASSLSLSWDDTSFQKYLLKFEIVPDTAGIKKWNVVFEKVDKLKNKTTKIHQYFDLGEFSVSAQDLVWLSDEVKKSETEMRSYFYNKDHEKKKEKKDTVLFK